MRTRHASYKSRPVPTEHEIAVCSSKVRHYVKQHAKDAAARASRRGTKINVYEYTCEELLAVVRRDPGITLKNAIAEIKHHYSSNKSATSSIAYWVERGKVDGVRIERGDALRLFPVERRGGA